MKEVWVLPCPVHGVHYFQLAVACTVSLLGTGEVAIHCLVSLSMGAFAHCSHSLLTVAANLPSVQRERMK